MVIKIIPNDYRSFEKATACACIVCSSQIEPHDTNTDCAMSSCTVVVVHIKLCSPSMLTVVTLIYRIPYDHRTCFALIYVTIAHDQNDVPNLLCL